MNRTRINPARRPVRPKRHARGGTLLGIFLGLILGLAIAAAVAYYLGRSGFTAPAPATPSTKDGMRTGKAETAAPDKPRFDFYTILPGSETPVTEQEIKQSKAGQQQADPVAVSENYYLQVGAFQTEQEADNMKAKLALLGLEAVVQTANVPDKGVWHRVRVGPYTEIDQITKARGELTKNGFTADLIKIHSNVPDQ